MKRRKIVLNGKFLSAAPTGVHRVAMELGNALADLIAEGHPSVRDLELAVSAPVNGMNRAAELRVPARLLGPFKGIPWEQISFPLRERKGTLLNLCNIGPVLARNAVTMIHDVQVHLSPDSYSMGFRMWYRATQPLLARRHRHILTVSEFSRQEIAKLGLCALDRVSVVHNGVDHILRVPSDPSIVAQLGLSRTPYVLGLSTTQAHKNIGMLMTAFADPRLAKVQLVLFGGTPRTAFEAQGVAVPGNVVFAGRVSDNSLRALIEGALCLTFPSTTEGFGLPPLEAMLLGCPAIVAPCGALPEVCGDVALYGAPDRPQEWILAIDKLSQDAAFRAHLSEAGIAHAERFTWRHSAMTLANILKRI
jgi:glycosyltransferase involved in cell wall biosynthesis